MAARRRSDSELPHAPLELLHPLLLPGADIPGAEILGELGCTPDATTLLQLYRAVLAWSAHPENSPALDTAALERTEFALLSRGPDALASPAGLLAGYMAQPEAATQREVAWVCICIADWATERGARATALRFTEAAALAWPRHARYAWMVARMLRAQNKVRESEAWFRRAHRVAVWSDDWEAQARTLNSLGNLNLAIGRIDRAKRLHCRALKVARRFGERTLEGEVCHDLFIVHAGVGDREEAEAFAAQALTAYGPAHRNLPMLVHDVAQFWAELGFYWRALPIFQALIRRKDLPHGGIREFAAASRVAGTAGDRRLFDQYSARVSQLLPTAPEDVAAAALYLVGLGLEWLGESRRATEMLQHALRLSEQTSAAEMIARCEAALLRLSQAEDAPALERGRRELDHTHPGDLLALQMAQDLGPAVMGDPRPREVVESIPATVEDPPPINGRTVGLDRVRGSRGIPRRGTAPAT